MHGKFMRELDFLFLKSL